MDYTKNIIHNNNNNTLTSVRSLNGVAPRTFKLDRKSRKNVEGKLFINISTYWYYEGTWRTQTWKVATC